MYLARDKNKNLYLFYKTPRRGRDCWWADSELDGSYLQIDKGLYPEVTWDSEPLQVELVVPS